MSKNKHIGSDFDVFLTEQGGLEEATAIAVKRVIAWQIEQAMQTIRSAGDSSFDAAGRLGSVLISLRETAATASQQIEGTVDRLGKLAQQMPAASAPQISWPSAVRPQGARFR